MKLHRVNNFNAIMIDIQQNSKEFLPELSASENVATSALHYMITEVQLGILCGRKYSNDVYSGGFKFEDDFSLIRIELERLLFDSTFADMIDSHLQAGD